MPPLRGFVTCYCLPYVAFCVFFGSLALLQGSLLHELRRVFLEPFFAGDAAKIIGLAVMGNLELGCFIV
jgi:hypothetical protein